MLPAGLTALAGAPVAEHAAARTETVATKATTQLRTASARLMRLSPPRRTAWHLLAPLRRGCPQHVTVGPFRSTSNRPRPPTSSRPARISSGWPDLNRRPLDPQSSALTKLRHSPFTVVRGQSPRTAATLPSAPSFGPACNHEGNPRSVTGHLGFVSQVSVERKITL